MKGPSPERVAEFAAAARRLAVERVDAADLVSQLLRDTPREQWMSLADRRELHTNGSLERLSREIDTALDRQPQDALLLSALAVSLADSLADDQYPPVVTAQIRAHAWKDRAQALSFNGKHDEAVDAIDRAEKILENFGTVAHDRAVARFVKATILQNLRRFDESHVLLLACRKVFAQHGDRKRLVACGIAEGMLLFRQGRFEEATEAFTPLVDLAEGLRDSASLAAIHNNLGFCLLEMGDITSANIHFSDAIALLNDHGNMVDVLRTEMAIGRLLITKGQTAHGLVRLRRARGQFLSNRLTEEAAICGLDIAAVLLIEEREREARELVNVVMSDLRGAQLNERGRAALNYLERELAAHDATPAIVRHASEFLQTSHSESAGESVAM
jgi:tetratricopeptide (TPR) repeat protein